MAQTIPIDRTSPTPIFRQLEEYIINSIRNGELKPGDQIPSQYVLARECRVSRATVQKALDRLMLDDVLYSQRGKGIYVANPVTEQHLPILQSISQSLRQLGHAVYADMLLVEETEAPGYIIEALHLPYQTNVFHVKRLQNVNSEPMVLQESYLDARRFAGLDSYDLRRQSLTQIMQEIGDMKIADSVLSIGVMNANWDESRQLNVKAGASLLVIEETDFDEDGQPVRFSRNKLKGDRFRVNTSTRSDDRISLEFRVQPGVVNIVLN
jgi:GntR family transcriptional regulator